MKDERRRSSGSSKNQLFHEQELERVLRSAIADGRLQGHESLTAAVSVTSEKVGLTATIYSTIDL